MTKLKDYKGGFNIKKVGILLGTLLLGVALGSGKNNAFADQDINSLLTNWFGSKKTQSITEIDTAITEEKDKLMIGLKVALKEEMKIAKEDLEKFTNEEKEIRILTLKKYADSLKPKMKIDISDQKQEVTVNFDAIIEEAIAKMNGLTTPTQPPISPKTEVEPEPGQTPDPEAEANPTPDPIPDPTPNPTPDPEAGTNPEPKPDPGTETNPTVEPEPATKPESTPVPATKPEPTPEPDSN